MFRFPKMMLAVVAGLGLLASCAEVKAQYVDPNQVANPVYQSGVRIDGFSFDYRTGRWVPHTSGTTVYDSVANPYRGYAIPGSVRYVDGWQIDAGGAPVRVSGWQWTSVTGQEHGNLSRTRFTPSGTHGEKVFYRRQ